MIKWHEKKQNFYEYVRLILSAFLFFLTIFHFNLSYMLPQKILIDWNNLSAIEISYYFGFFYWITADGSYVIYNEIRGAMYFRLPNFLASSLLYFICAGFWMYRGDLKLLKA